MAEERTMMHPSGYVIHIGAVDETYMHPSGYVVQSDITTTPPAPTFKAAWARRQSQIIGAGVN